MAPWCARRAGSTAQPFGGFGRQRGAAGFAGLAALIAAIVAYAAARHTAASAREQAQADRALAERRDRKSQWWSRAEWALTQVASGDAYAAVIGTGVLEAAARTRVVADARRGVETEPWIVELSKKTA